MNKVFIVGCPRSGTTMLGSILGNSEDCFTTPESQFKFKLFTKNLSKEALIENLKKDFRVKIWELDSECIEKSVRFSNSKSEILEKFLTAYCSRLNIEKNVWVDHTPENMKYIKCILREYNQAKIIFLIRDGRAVMNSFLKLNWGPNNAFEAASKWNQYNAIGFAALNIFKDHIYLIKYEDIVRKPHKTISKLCKFLGVRYHDNMLFGDSTILHNYTKKQHQEIGHKPIKDFINKWKYEADVRDIQIFEKESSTLLDLLEYELSISDYKRIPVYEYKVKLMALLKKQTNKLHKLYRRGKI